MKKKLLGLTFMALTFGLTGCDGERFNDVPAAGSQDSLTIAIRNTIDNNVIPNIKRFNELGDRFKQDTISYCGDGLSATEINDLQTQWKTLSLAWNKISIHNYGPLNNDLISPRIHRIESKRQRGTNYSATVRTDLSNFLSDTSQSTDFSTKNFTVTGLLALELALFENSQTQSTVIADIENDYQTNTRKCTYLQAMSTDLSRVANEVYQQWTEKFEDKSKSYRDLMLSNELGDDQTAEKRLIIAVQEHLDYLKRRKAEGVMDAQVAQYGFEQISAGLNEVESLITNSGEAGDYRIFDHMKSNGETQDIESVKQNINAAKAASLAQNKSELATYLALLDGNFKREIPDGLSVTLGINFSDGD